MGLGIILVLVICALACEYTDSTLGMGYGTTLTPLLLIMGFEPLQIVPVVLVSELVTGVLAGILHHREGNIDFQKSANRRLAVIFGLCGIVGSALAVFLAVQVATVWLKGYIAVLVTSLGIFMILLRHQQLRFSWFRVGLIGLLASFNKGLSGGGYGPLVCSGQILSGVGAKEAVAITSVAESLVCLVGVVTYLFVDGKAMDWTLLPWVVLGAVVSVPLSAKTVKYIPEQGFRTVVGVMTLLLGLFCLFQIWH